MGTGCESVASSEMGFKAVGPDSWAAQRAKRTCYRDVGIWTLFRGFGRVLVVESDQVWAGGLCEVHSTSSQYCASLCHIDWTHHCWSKT